MAFIGVGLSLVVTVVLGFTILSATRSHLLAAQGEIVTNVIAEIEADHPSLPTGLADVGFQAFDADVRLRLIGGDTLRVKVWAPDGTVVYSDDPRLIGSKFELSASARSALNGETVSSISDVLDPAHADERAVGSLIEFFTPYRDASGEIRGAFEVEQRIDTLRRTLDQVGTIVWITIGTGLFLLGGFMLTLQLARARAYNERRRQTEALLGELLNVQEDERQRIVGALHDDIGQPLYRLLYGLEGGKSRLPDSSVVRAELDRLAALVRDIDSRLRTELRLLHGGIAEDLDLRSALNELVDATRQETGMEINCTVELDVEPDPVPRFALLRAAQEAITNVRKHSGANSMSISVRNRGHAVILEVADDGSGIRGPEGLGLKTMRERLQAIGGGFEVTINRTGGTHFKAWVPIPEETA